MNYDILVTGGAGYLGSVMVPELLNRGHRVTVVDSFRYRQNSLAHICYHENLKIIRGDVRVEHVMAPLLAKSDIIIPLAALVGAPLCEEDPFTATTTNRDAVRWIVRHASKTQRILIPSTNSCYGNGDIDIYCDEKTPMKPISLYATNKVEAEEAVLNHGNSISFRLATAFGMSPRMRLDLLVNDFTYRAVNDKFVVLFEANFKRNFVHVRDIARVFIHGIDHFESLKNEIYNVGLAEANVSKLDLCRIIQKHVPAFTVVEAAIGKDPDQRNYLISHEKIAAAGFTPACSLDWGIQELIKGYAMVKNRRYANV